MTELLKTIQNADEEYLIALSNKGIYKRSCSDLEKTEVSVISAEESRICVKVGDEQVILSLPLTSSSCSCPSTSVCKHIIMAIMFAGKELCTPSESAETQSEQIPAIIECLNNYSLSSLIRAAGTARIKEINNRIRSGVLPTIERGSVITVKMEDIGVSVRLIDSPENSNCSCHSQLLCSHKAEAAIWLMLDEKIITPEQLSGTDEDSGEIITEEMKNAVDSVLTTACQWLSTGLCRLDNTAVQQAEQLAIICHNAQLAGFERRCRAIASMLADYNSRSSLLHADEIMNAVLSLYYDAVKLPELSDEKAQSVIGEFREVYNPVPPLDLALVSERDFSGRSGYEGTVYYFFECSRKRWYTLVNARPNFYDGSKRRKGSYQKVWNLDFEVDRLYGKRFLLANVKASEEKLSATAKASAEITGEFTADESSLSDVIVYRFSELAERLDKDFESAPIIISPQKLKESSFDNIAQRYSVTAEDAEGVNLKLSLKYSSRDERVIRAFENVYKNFCETGAEPPLILGTLYILNGQLMLYPIEIISRGRDSK